MFTTAQVSHIMIDSDGYRSILIPSVKERYAPFRVDGYHTSLNGVGHL